MKLLLLPLISAVLAGQVSVSITAPVSGEAIGQIYQSQGAVSSSAAAITDVSLSLDGGAFSATSLLGSPPSGWLTSIYAKMMIIGAHTMTVRATDAMSNTATVGPLSFSVIHSSPVCSHTPVKTGVYCETFGSTVVSGSAALTFSGYNVGDTIVVPVSANLANTPWTAPQLTNTAGFTWHFWGNVNSNLLGDGNLVQDALWWTKVPSATGSDTITASNSMSGFTVMEAYVYSGLGAIDGPGGSNTGFTDPHGVTGDCSPPLTNTVKAETCNYSVSVGDIAMAFMFGAPVVPDSGWTERGEDVSRPWMMLADQIATGTTVNAKWFANVDGYIAIGVAFKPALGGGVSHTTTMFPIVLDLPTAGTPYQSATINGTLTVVQ